MAYLPELHRCCVCGVDLGPDNGDGICCVCDEPESDLEEMTMSDHTPGPWRIDDSPTVEEMTDIRSAAGHLIACVNAVEAGAIAGMNYQGCGGSSQANARLIAAAPALVAACEAALAVMTGPGYGGAEGTTDAISKLRDALDLARKEN